MKGLEMASSLLESTFASGGEISVKDLAWIFLCKYWNRWVPIETCWDIASNHPETPGLCA